MSTALTRVEAKGWCPSAYQPMESGDGLVVRVRPRLARLTAEQISSSQTVRTYRAGAFKPPVMSLCWRI